MQATAAAVKGSIGNLGGAFMISREAKAFAQETGLAGWTPYFRGRCGVLGEVDADVVAAAAGFFPPDVVRAAWEAGSAIPAAEAAARYSEMCQGFGARKLGALTDDEATRLAGLIEAVCDHAGVVPAPLFAGWRAMPRPAEPRGRAIQAAHVLRELRGGLHVVAVHTVGLAPLEAVLGNATGLVPIGEGNAEFFGWPRPYPALTDDTRERRARAEELTDALVAPAFGVLDDRERAELADLLHRAEKAVFG